MTRLAMTGKPIGRQSYEPFARRYADAVATKPHNALYERPATRALLPPVAGKRVLDAGCGPGINSAWLAEQGATVVAIDVTPEMIAIAGERCAGLAVETRLADIDDKLDFLDDASIDIVLSALSLDYVEDWRRPFAEFRRVLRPGGCLVFSAGHPMADWRFSGHAGPFHDTVRFTMAWKGFGEPNPLVTAYRRSFAAIVNPIVEAGLVFERLVEPRPAPEMRAVAPQLFDRLSNEPCFVCVRARRP